MLQDGRHFAEMHNGVVRIIDSLTGRVVSMQSSYKTVEAADFTDVLLPDGSTVQVQKGLEKYALDAMKVPELLPYLIDVLCQNMVEKGWGLSKVCALPGMPTYATVCRWRRKHPWVAEALKEARIDRAERMRDLAVETAEQSENPEDTIDADKLKVDTYKWAAGVDDSRFSPKSKVDATLSLPQQLVIITGIDREGIDSQTVARDTIRDVSPASHPKEEKKDG